MSYTPPPAPNQAPPPFGGPNGAYVPPPPPPRKKSPWLFVGLGCGLLALLSFGGCVLLLGSMGNNIAAEMKKPLDKKAVLAGMGEIPQYPGSQLSEQMTKIQRATFSNPMMKLVTKGTTPEVAAFETKDEGTKVLEWYGKKMDGLGYEPSTSIQMPDMGKGTMDQKQYRKGTDAVIIQTQPNPSDSNANKTVFVIIQMKNIKE